MAVPADDPPVPLARVRRVVLDVAVSVSGLDRRVPASGATPEPMSAKRSTVPAELACDDSRRIADGRVTGAAAVEAAGFAGLADLAAAGLAYLVLGEH